MGVTKVLDVRGVKCPVPLLKAKRELDGMKAGEVLQVVATDRGSVLDFQGWVQSARGVRLLTQETQADPDGRTLFVHLLEKTT